MVREFKGILLIVLLTFLGGTIGYSMIEGWGIFDSLYMTIITLSTTGYQEIRLDGFRGSGVFYYQLSTEKEVASRKMILIN